MALNLKGAVTIKIGYNQSTAMKKSNLENDLMLTERFGYDYIEIWLHMLEEYLTSHSINELKDFFLKSKVKPYAFCSFEGVNFCNQERFAKIKERLEWACMLAQQITNPYIVIVPTVNESIKNYSAQEIEDDSIRVLNELTDISERYGIKLAFEPIGFRCCAVNNIKQGWEIVKKVNRDSVGLVIDAFNLYLYKALEDIEELEKVDFKKVFVFHIDDSEDIRIDKLKLDHSNRVWPGDGVIPLEKLLKILHKKGFDKIASVELFRPEVWELPPEEAIRMGKEKTEQVIRKYYK